MAVLPYGRRYGLGQNNMYKTGAGMESEGAHHCTATPVAPPPVADPWAGATWEGRRREREMLGEERLIFFGVLT